MNGDWLTETSAKHWDFVIQENLTAKEAVAFMKSGMKLRTFQDNLRAFYSGDDLEKRLVEGLCRCTGKSEQSVRRKVYNWMQNRNLPSDREELFCICFLLELDETASDFLLKRLTGEGIHYRNMEELIYAWCLKNSLGYEYARELMEELSANSLCAASKEIRQPESAGHGEENLPSVGDGQPELLTGAVKADFQKLRSHEELLQFILDRKSGLGNWHNTAYQYFDAMLGLLTKENGKTVYSLEKVADNYLRLNIPVDKRTSGYNCMQKLVKKHWPGSRSIKAMKSRTQDVTRKVLLLLYIVTEGVHDDSYEEMDEEGTSPEEFLEFHCRNMNRMLNECGMERIDPRGAFDFLILYSIRPEEDEFMSERMAEIVGELYRDVL